MRVLGFERKELNLNTQMLGYKIQMFNLNLQMLTFNTIITIFGLKLNMKRFVHNAWSLRMSLKANNQFD